MKNFLLFACLLFSTSIMAQIDVVVTPNPVHDFETVSDIEVVGKAVVKNESAETKTYIWERNVMCDDGLLQTWFCDPNLCYIPSVSTQTFSLASGEEGAFELHATFEAGVTRSLKVQIKVYEDGNEANFVDAMYELESCTPLALDEISIAEIDLFPNPTTDFFTLSNTDDIDNVVIHNLLGSPVRQFLASENYGYDVRDLATGIYLVQLYAKSGAIVGTKKLYKK